MSIPVIIGLAVFLVVFIAIAVQRSGPRVTHIETHRHEEDRKDVDDA